MVCQKNGFVLLLACIVIFQSPTGLASATRSDESPAGEERKTSSSARYERMESKSNELATAGNVAGLTSHLQSLKSDGDLTDAAREKLLRNALLMIADIEPDAGARETVRTLRSYPSQTFVWRNEHGHLEKELLYDVASAARYAEQQWEKNESYRVAAVELNSLDYAIVSRYSSASANERKGIEKAFRSADKAELERHRDELIADSGPTGSSGTLALIVADRLGDDALYRSVLMNADAPTALAAIKELQGGSTDVDRLSLLEIAAERPDTRSAALLAIGRQVGRTPAAENILFAKLGQEGGASAASALARTGDPVVIDRLAQVLGSDVPEMERRHALLGLRLARSDRARRHLALFEVDPDSPQALVREVR
jgi:hypothetical protein